MKRFLFLSLIFLMSCKSIVYDDVNSQKNPNNNLLPALEPVVDLYNLESVYSVGSNYGTTANYGYYNNNNYVGTSSINSTSYRDDRVNDAINIFNKEVKENITNPYGPKKGYISLKLGYRGTDSYKNILLVPSLLTIWTVNLVGMPTDIRKESLEVEVEIYNNDKELIKRYTNNALGTEYVAMWWGYGGYSARRKLAAGNLKKALSMIKADINADAEYINKKLK